jgi:hypothetical protein
MEQIIAELNKVRFAKDLACCLLPWICVAWFVDHHQTSVAMCASPVVCPRVPSAQFWRGYRTLLADVVMRSCLQDNMRLNKELKNSDGSRKGAGESRQFRLGLLRPALRAITDPDPHSCCCPPFRPTPTEQSMFVENRALKQEIEDLKVRVCTLGLCRFAGCVGGLETVVCCRPGQSDCVPAAAVCCATPI